MPDSKLYPGEQIFDDGTPEHMFEVPDGYSREGYKGMFSSPTQAASITQPFPANFIIPESDWQGWIQEEEERKSRVSDLVDAKGLPCKDQAQTSLCWGTSPTHLVEVARCIMGLPMVKLSNASVTGPVNGFRNRGGYGGDAVEELLNMGAVPEEFWPANTISAKYWTPENKARAAYYKIGSWLNLRPRNRVEHISALLRKMPCTVGLNFWGHQVSDYEAVWVNGQIGVRFRNSWGMSWGSQGYAIRQGSKMLADDIVCIRTAVAA